MLSLLVAACSGSRYEKDYQPLVQPGITSTLQGGRFEVETTEHVTFGGLIMPSMRVKLVAIDDQNLVRQTLDKVVPINPGVHEIEIRLEYSGGGRADYAKLRLDVQPNVAYKVKLKGSTRIGSLWIEGSNAQQSNILKFTRSSGY